MKLPGRSLPSGSAEGSTETIRLVPRDVFSCQRDPSEKKGKQQDLNTKTFVGAVLGQISTLFLFFFCYKLPLKNTKTPTLGCNQETSASGISLNLKNDTCCADWQRQQSYLCSSAFPRHFAQCQVLEKRAGITQTPIKSNNKTKLWKL